MRPLDRLCLLLDRTLVLFLGLAAGAAVTMSFFGGADAVSPAQAGPRLAPVAAASAPRSPEAVAPRLAAAVAQGRPIEIGVFGDSFGDGIWAGLHHRLGREPGFEVRQYSERSTGFTRYRSLNILDDVRAKLDRQPVDIAVLSFGANDTQGIYLDGHGNSFMSEGWQRIVGERVAAVVGLLRERGATVYWVGLPRMREPGFDADIQTMNRFYAARMAALGVPYVDTVPLTADASGRYAPYLTDPDNGRRVMARANDGIHMTIPGYVLVMRGLSQRIERAADLARARSAGRPGNPAAKAS